MSNSTHLFRRVREQLGLTQIEAAERLGVTQSAISKIEGRESVLFSDIILLCEGSGYDPEVHLHHKGSSKTVRIVC